MGTPLSSAPIHVPPLASRLAPRIRGHASQKGTGREQMVAPRTQGSLGEPSGADWLDHLEAAPPSARETPGQTLRLREGLSRSHSRCNNSALSTPPTLRIEGGCYCTLSELTCFCPNKNLLFFPFLGHCVAFIFRCSLQHPPLHTHPPPTPASAPPLYRGWVSIVFIPGCSTTIGSHLPVSQVWSLSSNHATALPTFPQQDPRLDDTPCS